jgi:hypothetical protein
MKIKHIQLATLTVIFCVGTFTIYSYAFGKRIKASKQTIQGNDRLSQLQNGEVSDHVVYWFLFNDVVFLKERGDENDRQGKPSGSIRSWFQREGKLNVAQGQLLEQVAVECKIEVAGLDAKATSIIKEFRSRYPGGRVPTGTKLPPPPPELAALQAERIAVILRARDRLRQGLNEQDFISFDDFVKRHFRVK